MTTYIVNGNSISPQITLDGITEAGDDEQFIVVTNDKCPAAYLGMIAKLCETYRSVSHRKVKTSRKKWFAGDVKSIYRNYLIAPEDRVVIMPTATVSGAGIEQYEHAGRFSMASDYKAYKGNASATTPRQDWSRMPIGETEAGGKMHILIDYENVSNAGLEGADYLTKDDHVTVFYSQSSEHIQQGYFDAIAQKAGSFDAVKLVELRKNGLDFYIAIRVGEILLKYPGEKILIVSQDQGYYAILDYCGAYAGMEGRIKFASSIEAGIVLLDGETSRCRKIIDSRRSMSIETQYDIYKEKRQLYQKIAALLADTPYADEIDRIFGLVETKDTPKKLYTASLHEFGIMHGREIYRLLKKGA